MRNIFETLVGTLVIVFALGFLMFAYHKSGTQTKSGGYILYAEFNNIDGLKMGSYVRIAGVKVGEVVSASLDKKNFNALIGVYLDSEVKLPVDSSAQIVSDGLLGDKYVSISAGSDSNFLQPGNSIIYTQSSVNLETLIGKLIFQSGDNKDKNANSNVSEASTAH